MVKPDPPSESDLNTVFENRPLYTLKTNQPISAERTLLGYVFTLGIRKTGEVWAEELVTN